MENKIDSIEKKTVSIEERVNQIFNNTGNLESNIIDIGNKVDNMDVPTKSNMDWLRSLEYQTDEEGRILIP